MSRFLRACLTLVMSLSSMVAAQTPTMAPPLPPILPQLKQAESPNSPKEFSHPRSTKKTHSHDQFIPKGHTDRQSQWPEGNIVPPAPQTLSDNHWESRNGKLLSSSRFSGGQIVEDYFPPVDFIEKSWRTSVGQSCLYSKPENIDLSCDGMIADPASNACSQLCGCRRAGIHQSRAPKSPVFARNDHCTNSTITYPASKVEGDCIAVKVSVLERQTVYREVLQLTPHGNLELTCEGQLSPLDCLIGPIEHVLETSLD